MKDEFSELSFYTLGHPDPVYFIHQHSVDAFQAQTASETTKPISLIFSLIGLYLYLKKNYTGRQVQQAHTRLAQNKKNWPKIELPTHRGEITVSDVLKAEPGQRRDAMIAAWCNSVWEAYANSHKTIATLAEIELKLI